MARAATTSDAFNAIAEPRRRLILTLLKGRERPVNDVAAALRIAQSRVSKQLRVLRQLGLVRVREAGKGRLYSLDARGLEPVHAWVGGFGVFWLRRGAPGHRRPTGVSRSGHVRPGGLPD